MRRAEEVFAEFQVRRRDVSSAIGTPEWQQNDMPTDDKDTRMRNAALGTMPRSFLWCIRHPLYQPPWSLKGHALRLQARKQT
mmetsp:Transcript_850/g.1465  ORF Transcript_850/g.1465 Transcript_850/m.1465 type:complete len:82 (+) Transcript_850:1295-1540(+)